MGLFGKKHGDPQRNYRNAADNYDSEWLSHEVSHEEPTVLDDIQSAPPVSLNSGRKDKK
jgi:hypothetical protein